VLEALVDGKDEEASGSAQPPGIEQPGQVGERAGIVRSVPAQDLAHALGHGDTVSR
jgi:hypothetical protein